VRLDLLPALERVRPGFSRELLAIARRAADWRQEMERLADAVVARDAMRSVEGEELRVGVRALEELDAPSLAVLWPVLAARRGVTLDRRGTRRLAEFTIIGKPGGAIQLAGEVEVVRRRDEFVLRPLRAHTSIRSRAPEAAGPPPAVSLDGTAASLGAWRFEPVSGGVTGPEGAWRARLPAGAVLTARPWRAGDRMRVAPGGAARRVKRFFGDARVAGVDRAGWPVVLVDGEIVWIPGVRRAAAATVPSGQPGLCYACYKARERNLD
jgi:tRNA(Ile)-lysidine synthase